jgi:hypothetical protein
MKLLSKTIVFVEKKNGCLMAETLECCRLGDERERLMQFELRALEVNRGFVFLMTRRCAYGFVVVDGHTEKHGGKRAV